MLKYTFRKLDREKSFDEARTAVQSQIEKIFKKANGQINGGGSHEGGDGPLQRRYKMHGISHISPDDDSLGRAAPPPTHHGLKYAISNHPLARWNANDTPPHSVYNHSPPVISRHDSIESLRHRQDDSMHRLSHHSSMFSLANSDSIPPPSPPRKAGSAPPGHPVPVPRETLRRKKPYNSLADLSSTQQQQNLHGAVSQPIRLSPLDRSSSQLSLLYGTSSINSAGNNRNGHATAHNQTGVQRQESLLEQARRISLGQTPSPPARVARHHSQNLHISSRSAAQMQEEQLTASGQVKMTRSMSYVSSFSHLSVAKNNDLLNEGLNGVGVQGSRMSQSALGVGSNGHGFFQNPFRYKTSFILISSLNFNFIGFVFKKSV
jgi:hypothetical protein